GGAGRSWLARLAAGAVHEDTVGAGEGGPVLGWIGPRRFTEAEADRLREAARFAAAPLAALSARATLSAALEAYLGRRSAARVLAGPLRREVGETIRAVLLYGDLRGFTALSESEPPAAVIAALGGWFDCIGGAVHAFGGEVLKFIDRKSTRLNSSHVSISYAVFCLKKKKKKKKKDKILYRLHDSAQI